MQPPGEQLRLDFTSKTAETLARIRSAGQRLAMQLAPDVAAGVVDLLERVALTAHDHTHSQARAATLAAGLSDRRPVSERTIRRWRTAAEQITTSAGPLLLVAHRSSHWGGRHTNLWQINWPAIGQLTRGEPAHMPTPAPTTDQPTSTTATTPADPWATTEAILTAAGWTTAASMTRRARKLGQAPGQLLAAADHALATARANAAQFRDPQAAAAYFLARGTWPTPTGAIKSLEQHDQAKAARAALALEQARKSQFAAIIKHGRRSGQTDDHISHQLAAQLPADWLAANGWPVTTSEAPT